MKKTYLFDWGDTLMVDFPGSHGKMFLWETLECVEGAKSTLSTLSQSNTIYIATGAVDSREHEIKSAFDRVGLSEYISGYFCHANIGLHKTSAAFYDAISQRLQIPKSQIFMVGDTFNKDICPALTSGINAIWYNPSNLPQPELELALSKGQSFSLIHTLYQLCE
ncbi:MAG: HAD family hydrolase [Paraglaciecola polaris]|uniref:HAD family hydrolase n=1 Tax=Paraglaciecola polaris TaxID=222814 RepID=UPI003002BA90|tara:strand:- start:3607 stop:4101 length:495 start_codon:yes stop_codon:yes gene_type:complete